MSSPGLRERKKQRTRWAIRDHALRLFAAQGYEATTVDQIAAAAEISPSTFFRYFRTKEDLVVEDEYDEVIETTLAALPAELSPLEAIRATVRGAFGALDADEMRKILDRTRLIMSVPALRARSLENYLATVSMLARATGQRVGRSPSDLEVRVFASSVVGAMLGVIDIWVESDGEIDLAETVDVALAYLEAGLPL